MGQAVPVRNVAVGLLLLALVAVVGLLLVDIVNHQPSRLPQHPFLPY